MPSRTPGEIGASRLENVASVPQDWGQGIAKAAFLMALYPDREDHGPRAIQSRLWRIEIREGRVPDRHRVETKQHRPWGARRSSPRGALDPMSAKLDLDRKGHAREFETRRST